MNVDTIFCTIEMEPLPRLFIYFTSILISLDTSLQLNGTMHIGRTSFGLVKYDIGQPQSQGVIMYNMEGTYTSVYKTLFGT